MNQYLIMSKENEKFQDISSRIFLNDPGSVVRRIQSAWDLLQAAAEEDAEFVVIKLKEHREGQLPVHPAEKKDTKEEAVKKETAGTLPGRLEELYTYNPGYLTIDKDLELLQRYISDHLGDNLNLKNLSSRLYLSKNYLSSTFSKMVGMKLKDYIVRQRMERACKLLRESEFSIRDIAALVGYSSPSHFSQTFRQVFRETPSTYRKKCRCLPDYRISCLPAEKPFIQPSGS